MRSAGDDESSDVLRSGMMKIMIVCSRYGPPWDEGVKNMVRVMEERLTDLGVTTKVFSKDTGKDQSAENPARWMLPWILIKLMVFWWKAAREARQQNVDAIHLISDVSPIVGP